MNYQIQLLLSNSNFSLPQLLLLRPDWLLRITSTSNTCKPHKLLKSTLIFFSYTRNGSFGRVKVHFLQRKLISTASFLHIFYPLPQVGWWWIRYCWISLGLLRPFCSISRPNELFIALNPSQIYCRVHQDVQISPYWTFSPSVLVISRRGVVF